MHLFWDFSKLNKESASLLGLYKIYPAAKKFPSSFTDRSLYQHHSLEAPVIMDGYFTNLHGGAEQGTAY